MKRTGECVLNLPSVDLVAAVDRLARTTGSNPVPARKIQRGYRFERDKFSIAGLTPMESETVWPPRVKECQVQLEAVVEAVHHLAEDDPKLKGRTNIFEVRIQRVQRSHRFPRRCTAVPTSTAPGKRCPTRKKSVRDQCTNSRMAPSSPSSVSGNIRLENSRCTSRIDCV
jgi:flavin reductase (DIM6/NTAB) family NADH-FMN oxidoreductase RutF